MIHRQIPSSLYRDPISEIRAQVRLQWRHPIGRILVTLLLVHIVGHGQQCAAVCCVVGIRITCGSRPGPCARVPSFFQSNNMININVRWVRPSRTVIGRYPVASNYFAFIWVHLRQSHTVAFEYLFARITSVTVNVSPVFKQCAHVSSRTLVLDANSLQNTQPRTSARLHRV